MKAIELLELESLFRSESRYCFLAGAGISSGPPSNIPTGLNLTKIILTEIVSANQFDDIAAFTDPDHLNQRDFNDFIRFEQLMAYTKSVGLDKEVLSQFVFTKKPNINHYFLAKMLKNKHQVCTTNFDNLIEQALYESGISREFIFPLIEWFEWEQANDEDQYYIHKLHGTVYDFRAKRKCIESVQSTLRDIVKGKNVLFELEPWKKQRLARLLCNYDLVVIGYSGLDDFDIVPTLMSIQSSKSLLWINHDEKRLLDQIKIEIVDQQNNFKIRSRLDHLLLEFAELKVRPVNSIIKITVNTQQLIEWLWKKYIQVEPVFKPYQDAIQKHNLKFNEMLNEEKRWFLTGNIFKDLGYLKRARFCFMSALDSPSKELTGWILEKLMLCAKELGEFDIAKDYFLQAIKEAHARKDYLLDATVVTDAAQLIYRSNPDLALRLLNSAFNYFEQENDLQGKARTLIDIGRCLALNGKKKEGMDKFWQALIFTKIGGDLMLQADCLTAIAEYYDQDGDFQQAIEYYDESLKIYSRIGAIFCKLKTLNKLGIICRKTSNIEGLKRARNCYESALIIAKASGDQENQAATLNNLGLVSRKLGDYSGSHTYHLEARGIFKEIDDFDGLARSYVNLGTLNYEKEEYYEALENYERAKKIFLKMKNKTMVIFTEENIEGIRSQIHGGAS